MTRRPALIAAAMLLTALLTACAGGGTRITDFSDRSVGYGWLDIKEVEANRLESVQIYQFRPRTAEPYYSTAIREFKNGYLYYTLALPNGAHKLESASGLRCLGVLCGNTVYRYSFGKQGDEAGAVVINTPGVYYLGSYRLTPIKTGFFEAGKFDVAPATNGPSRREMLEEILRQVSDNPVMAARVRDELARTR
jgi:hypothetical protein